MSELYTLKQCINHKKLSFTENHAEIHTMGPVLSDTMYIEKCFFLSVCSQNDTNAAVLLAETAHPKTILSRKIQCACCVTLDPPLPLWQFGHESN